MANNPYPPYQPGQIISVSGTTPVQQQIMPIGGAGGAGYGYAGNTWGNNHLNQGNYGIGAGVGLANGGFGQYAGGGGGAGCVTSTNSWGNIQGAYSPPPIDPTEHLRAAARYDGIMCAYWEAILDEFELPWLGGDTVFERAKLFCAVFSGTPIPHEWVKSLDARRRREAEVDEYQPPLWAQQGNALAMQQALDNATLSQPPTPSWYQQTLGKLFGGGNGGP